MFRQCKGRNRQLANNDELRNNLFSFRDAFKDYTDCYTVIGGTACFILMDDAARDFRATSDIDMILVFEDKREDFGKIFWNYIIEGGYKCEQKKNEKHYYRFINPKPGYPEQIELFSRREDFKIDQRIIPVFISEDISSLSAIALDDDFYTFMMKGRRVVDNICVLDANYLIPFKMYAWLNNKDDRDNNVRMVNSKDIKKHKKDVFLLMSLVNPDNKVETSGTVRKTVERFLSEIMEDSFKPQDINIKKDKEEMVEILRNIYL